MKKIHKINYYPKIGDKITLWGNFFYEHGQWFFCDKIHKSKKDALADLADDCLPSATVKIEFKIGDRLSNRKKQEFREYWRDDF